jgi:DNA-binding NarL/FixJ family response regulator
MAGMNLSYRPVRVDDFEPCLHILEEAFAFEECVLGLLPALWRTLHRERRMISAVVEDKHRPPEQRLVAFGASVFVTDEFMNEVRERPLPFLSVKVINRILNNDSPILTQAVMRHANSHDGLNLLMLHHSWAKEIVSADEASFVRIQVVLASLDYHSGYNLKEIIAEGIGEEEMRWVMSGGSFHLRSMYESYYESHPLPPSHQRPHLVGLTRAEALVRESSSLSPLFVYTPPRFFFRAGEQELLKQALLGETDDDLAVTLNISRSAVKKRWNAIYDRVAAQDADLLPNAFDSNHNRRGAQKRHLLLRYLRHHPEELRPAERVSPADRSMPA